MTPQQKPTPAAAARIHVCSLARLHQTARQADAGYVVSLVGPGVDVPRPDGISADNHLRLNFNDISAPADGLVPPGMGDVQRLLDFVHRWPADAALVVHCWAGVSRSTAAAYITLCALQPAVAESALALKLRQASPTATPNARLVELADAALQRSNRMVAAIKSIGRGASVTEGIPFHLGLETGKS